MMVTASSGQADLFIGYASYAHRRTVRPGRGGARSLAGGGLGWREKYSTLEKRVSRFANACRPIIQILRTWVPKPTNNSFKVMV
jgi:hypothetical protein